MIQGSRAIRDHRDEQRALRVFDGVAGEVTYLGAFEIDEVKPWYVDRAPETGGGPLRDVIVFRLRPQGPFFAIEDAGTVPRLEPTLVTRYEPVGEVSRREPSETFTIDPDVIDRGVQGHMATQDLLAEYVEQTLGLTPLKPGPGDPAFDVGWWQDSRFVVAEVKSATDSNEIAQLRLGLGQVLDYADQLRRADKNPLPVLAIERAPTDDRWVELCATHGVTLVWPDGLDRLRQLSRAYERRVSRRLQSPEIGR